MDEYIIEPHVSVTLEKAMSARYSVMGKVESPGIRIMDRKVSLFEAIAESGGITKEGERKKIAILRYDNQGNLARQDVDLSEIEKGKAPMVFLNPGDQVIVPKKGSAKFTNDTIREIHFTNTENGWLLCERDTFTLGATSPSYLLKTKDGGQTFERVEFEGAKRERIADIFFTKYGIGFAVGETGAIFTMQEDRTTWKRQPAPSHFLLVGGTFQNAKNGIIVGGGGNIFFTEDSGYTWKNATLINNPKSRFNAVFFLNDKLGWTVGTDGKIFQTINGGKMWRSQNSGVNAELNDIAFLDTREGYAVGADGTILYSNTAGNVWTTITSKTNHRLEKLFFNDRKGWAVGYGGTILKYQKENQVDKSRPKLQVK